MRTYLATPGLKLTLVPLPAYSPDFNSDEAIWDWAREEVTANRCLGTQSKLHEALAEFFAGLAKRTNEVMRRCRTILQAQTRDLALHTVPQVAATQHVDFTLALV